jgi:class 3 adenylate cyclase
MNPETVALIAVLLGGAALFWHERRERLRLRQRLEDAATNLERLQHTFARFAPGPLVDHVITGGVENIGAKREVTALFADLVGYTPLAERTEPAELVELLNGYYEQMSTAIENHRGHVSTFLGDGMLALFGAFEPNPWQGDDAVHAALAMRERLAVYNAELKRRGKAPLAIGIGLHRGTGVAGLVGSHGKKEFAIVGRVVNIAARVQAATREQETDILITDELARTIDPRFVLAPLPPLELRGIDQPVQLHTVRGFERQVTS